MTVEDIAARAAATNPTAPALASPERSWTFAELSEWVGRVADRLREEGALQGTRIPMVLQPDAEGVVELLACWRLGATAAPLSPALSAQEHEAARATLTGAGGEAQVVLWTSGTEGNPRGVALSAKNLRASAAAAALRLGLGPEDVWLASLPLAHVGGVALVTRALLLGGLLVAPGRFDAAVASGLIDGDPKLSGPGRPVTHASLVPTQLLRLLDDRSGRPPPATFRCLLLGGAHAPTDLVARATEEGWPVALTYGMTEMTSQVATAPPPLVRAKPGTVGPALEGVEIRVGDDGEILARGPTRAIAYVGASETLADSAGWYHTGDAGRIDAERHLWITGRIADRIVSGGVTVDAREVEDALRSRAEIADACVVGLPDPEWGEIVAAALVPAEGTLDLEALRSWTRERLAPAKRPRRWVLLERLPVNPNGKVDRHLVTESFGETGGVRLPTR